MLSAPCPTLIQRSQRKDKSENIEQRPHSREYYNFMDVPLCLLTFSLFLTHQSIYTLRLTILITSNLKLITYNLFLYALRINDVPND